MKTPVLHFMFLALLGSFFTPLAVAYASPSLADSVHFCQLIDFEQSERDRGPAAKRLQNLNVGEPRTVRLIYFLPNDRPYRADVVQKMKTQILEIQTFYAEQMAVHGHGNKTFQIETDAQGEPLVHRVDGQLPASSYEGASTSEIQQVFDVDANIYFIVFDIGSETLGRALGLATQSTKNGGYALVTDEFSFITAAHELGHTFGLYHDFRDNRYIMSYGLERHPLSACAAEFLAVHTYFNPDSPIEKTSPPTIELISPTEYPAGSESVSVQLRATDSDGLHQVIPFVLTKNIFFGAGFPEVKACYGLGSKTETVVVYDYDGDIPSDDYTSLASTPSHNLRAMVVDTDGNQTWTSFRLTEASSYHIATLEGHTNDVQSVAFSPDGTMLASGSQDNTVRLWDMATRASIGTLQEGGVVQSVAFSPDGMTLASGAQAWPWTVKLWDVATRTSIGTLQDGGGIRSVAFSPNGATLASGSTGTIKLFDVATRTNINTLTYSMNPTVWDVAFSPDGNTLASGASDSAIKLWDVATGADIATLEHTSWVRSVAFSPNGTMLASAAGTLVRLWDVATRTNINTLEGHTYGVYSVAFSPDGATLASGSGDGTIRLWDVLTGKELAVFPSSSPSVAFSPDGTMLASGSYDNTVELWDTSEWTQPRLHRLVKISGDNQQGTPDAALANPLIVEARDQYGNPLPDAQVTFTVTAGEGQLSGWFTIEHATTDADGRVELTFTLGPYAGTNTVGVSIAGRELVTFNAMGIGTPTVSIMDGDYRTWSLPNGAIARLGKGSLGETDRAVALSPDRQHLAVASSIGVWLYDVTTGRELALLPMANVRSVAFSPDGMKLASYGTEGITLWDVATGANIATFRGGSPVFSPDGTILASLWGNTVRLWDVATGANIANLEGHTQSLASVSFSPDGTILASGSRDNTVRLWDMATRTSIATLEGHGYYVRSVAFSPDGAILASGSDREVKLWDVATRANVATLEGGFFVAFSPDGTTLASGGVNSLIKLWDVVTGTQINTFEGHTGRVFSVAFSPNGTTLVSGGADDTVRLWDMAMGSVAILSGHTGRVFSVAFSPDGTTLASGGMNSLVKLWDVATGRVAILSGHTGEVFSVAFSPDGTTLASGALNDFGRLWDVAMGTQINTLGRSGWSVAFSPDGTILASGHTDRTIKLWDVATGTQINTFEGHTDWVRSVAFSPDGTILASGSFDNTLKLWDMATGTNSATLSGHTNDVESVAFSPDGTTLASGARDQKVLLWDVATRASIGTLEDRENVLSVAFSPDGAILASGAGTEVTLWDAATNTNSATLSGHASTVNSVAFSSDAATLASSSDDGTILLWDTSAWTTPPVVNHPPTGVVTISGTAAVGEILTADASTVMDPDGPSTLEFSYQWLADASPIAGATSQTYTLTANEIGKKIRVRVSYIDGLGALVNITSEETELFAGICDRTEEVQTVILNLIAGVSDCALVTGAHLAAITELDLEGQSIPALQVGDFDGLTALTSLNLDNNQLTALPVGIFDNLTNLIHLYLTDNQLTALPVGTFDNLGVLETLYLTNNQLTALPEGIDNLTTLTRLALNSNPLTALPEGIFDKLTNLTHLDLAGSQLTTLPVGIDKLTNLTSLDLAINQLTALPVGIDKLTNLTDLGLDRNQLTSLPVGVFDNLNALTTLYLAGNQLTALPVGIFDKLTNLTQLYLAGNQLTALPEGIFGNLNALTTLHLDGNQLTALPEGIFDGISLLTTLTLYNGPVDPLPLMVSLEKVGADQVKAVAPSGVPFEMVLPLSVASGSISGGATTITISVGSVESQPLTVTRTPGTLAAVTVDIGTLPGLPANHQGYALVKSADLPLEMFSGITPVCDRTEEVREAIVAAAPVSACGDVAEAHLASITQLDLYEEKIRTLKPGDFDGLTVLTTLRLDGNELSSLPEGVFDGLTALTQLFLHDNQLSSLPAGIFNNNTALTTLYLHTNQLSLLPAGIFANNTALTSLTLSDNQLTSLPVGIFDNNTALTGLFLYDNQLSSLPEGVFDNNTALTQLYLHTNQLSSLPVGIFDNNTALTELHLYTNQLTSLPEGVFDNNTALTWLTLSGNQLSSLPAGIFDNNTALTQLSLGTNKLSSLPEGIFENLTALTHLYMDQNQLSSLPAGIFKNLIALTHLAVDSLPLIVSLEKVGEGQFKAVAPTGAPFDIVLPLSVTNGSISGGATTITISSGSIESTPLTVTRTAGTTTAVTVDIGTLPVRPANHRGYALVKSADLPLAFPELGGAVFTSVCDRTPQVRDAIVAAVSGVSNCRNVTEAHLAAITEFDLTYKNITSLKVGDFSGLSSVTLLQLHNNRLSSLPAGVFAGLSALKTIRMHNNQLTTLPDGAFSGLTALTRLELLQNQLRTLTAEGFSGLPALEELELNSNQLTELPDGVFSKLPTLTSLRLVSNQLSVLSPGAFSGLPALKTLHLYRNQLSTLPVDVFSGLTTLEDLNLQVNQLTELPNGIFDGLTALKRLDLNFNQLSTLPDGVFSELTSLTTLNLVSNQLRTLPDGIFSRLTSLTQLTLGRNPVEPLPLPVSLEKVADGQFKAVAPTGAPFEIVLPLTVANGSISGGATTIMIPVGSLESAPLTVTRTPGTTFAGTVDIGTLPGLPSGHSGYALGKSADLPLEMFSRLAGGITPVCDRTPQVQTAILGVLQLQNPSPSTCEEVTEAHLATGVTSLFLNGQGITALKAGDFEGLTSLTELRLYDNQLTTLPEDIFEGLAALTTLRFGNNQLTTLPEDIFEGLAALTTLRFGSNQLTTLPAGLFDGLTALTDLRMVGNQLTTLPDQLFERLTALTTLRLQGNSVDPLPLTVSLEKVGADQFKAVAPAGAPFDMVLPLTVTNGSISGGATTITIPAGSLDSESLTVTRTPGSTFAVTVDIGTLPGLPANHSGYALIKSADLPLVLTEGNIPNESVLTLTVGAGPGAALRGYNPHSDPDWNFGSLSSRTFVLNGVSYTMYRLYYNVAGKRLDFQTSPMLRGYELHLDSHLLRSFSALDYNLHQWNNVDLNWSVGQQVRVRVVETTPIPPRAPTNLTATPGYEKVTLSWEPPTNADPTSLPITEYEFRVSDDGGNTWNPDWDIISSSRSGQSNRTSCTIGDRDHNPNVDDIIDINLTNGTSYTFEIRARGGDGSGDAAHITAIPGGVIPVCDRTPQVRDAILDEISSISDCAQVTEAHLAAIAIRLSLDGQRFTALKAGDFDGLTALTTLVLSNTPLSSLPAGIFDNLTALTLLNLSQNDLSSLPADIFDNLNALTSLYLSQNDLSSLPAGIFDNLTALTTLDLGETQLSSLPAGVFDNLTALTRIELDQNQLSSLPAGVFDNLTALTFLNLFNNQLSTLPAGVFSGLSSLTSLYLNGNAVDPLPLTVSLEKVGADQVKAVAPSGAPFDMVLPLTVTSGSISGGATTLTIPAGSLESQPLTVTRTSGTTAAVTVDIGTLPGLPTNHSGYAFVKSSDLPLEIFSLLAGGICDRTPQVQTAILGALQSQTPSPSTCGEVTETHLATGITSLFLNGQSITALQADDFAGLTGLTELRLYDNQLTTLPADLFDGLTALTTLYLNGNQLSTLPEGLFDGLSSLATLYLYGNSVDPLPLTVSLEKVGTDQVKAVAPAGAPFDLVLPLTVTNGSISGGATSITIPAGSLESQPLTVTRTPSTTAAVTMDLGTLPRPPTNHSGYTLVKSTDLPLEIISATTPNTATVNIPDANLRANIETALGKTSGDPISPAEIATLTSLSAQDASISDLTGLETATNLTELQLWDNEHLGYCCRGGINQADQTVSVGQHHRGYIARGRIDQPDRSAAG